MVNIIRFYKTPGLSSSATNEKFNVISKLICPATINKITTETCFYVETQTILTDQELLQLRWILANVLNPDTLTGVTRLPDTVHERALLIEVGPR